VVKNSHFHNNALYAIGLHKKEKYFIKAYML